MPRNLWGRHEKIQTGSVNNLGTAWHSLAQLGRHINFATLGTGTSGFHTHNEAFLKIQIHLIVQMWTAQNRDFPDIIYGWTQLVFTKTESVLSPC